MSDVKAPPPAAEPPQVDMTAVRPYGDMLDDALLQVSFTLPVPNGSAGRRAALELAARLGLERTEVTHTQQLVKGYTHYVVLGRCPFTIDVAALEGEGFDTGSMNHEEVEEFVATELRRPVVVVGASTGADTHSVGIDAMLNLKGYQGHSGLEAYKGFETYNLGSQVPNAGLVAKAIEVGADAILVSQTVTGQDAHIRNLTELVELLEAEGRRDDVILVCGGARVSSELAKELGYDAGFSRGTYPEHLATFLVRELAARRTRAPVA
jgi:beta-lysine 5,6-aminomutase beta subunit